MIVTSAIWLVFVLAALWPPVRRGPLGFGVFVATMAFTEIPAVLMLAFALSIVFSGRPSGLSETMLGAALVAATAAGFAVLLFRTGTARAAFESGLDHGLGRQWRTVVGAGPPRGSLRPTPWGSGILLPGQRRTRRVTRTRNVAYGPDPAHRVDVYRRPQADGARPVLIHLHGGGFVSGGKSRESAAMLTRLAESGWLCLSGNYRLRGAGQHPNPLIDTKRMIAWVRENADELGADPSSVFLAGCSAGAHLAICAALTPHLTELQPEFGTADTSVAGAIAFYGYLGARDATRTSSPARLAGPDAPPMLIVHGANDTAVPVEDARAVADHLGRVSRNPVVFVELPHTQHSFDRFASVRARVAADATERFLDWARANDDARAWRRHTNAPPDG